MRNDVPAAFSLLVFATALGIAPHVVHPGASCAGLAIVAVLWLVAGRPRLAMTAAFMTAGLLVGYRDHAARAGQRQFLAAHGSDRFVTVEAPLDGDWSARPHVQVLRVSRFQAGGRKVRAPLAFYARFPPPIIRMEATIRAEGHLRPDRRGGYTMSLKSARLMRYEGRLSLINPASWNRVIANRLRAYAGTRPDDIAMIEALLLGRGERLAEQTKEDFKRGGTYHLLVFSGLQISLAAGVITLLLRWVGAARAADWSLFAFALIAPAFIGHEASVSRASTAIAAYAVSRIVRRPTTFENLWCVAAMIRLILVPADLVEPAFHLTYAGAGALLFIGRPLARSGLRWMAYVVAAEIAIAPLTLHHFHQYALGGSIMTIAMTPIVFVMLIAGACFSLVQLTPLLDVISLLNSLCTVMNRIASPLSGFFAAPSATSVSVGFGAAVAAIALLRGRLRTAAVIVALAVPPLTAFAAFHRASDVADPQLVALDVGQGDALLVRSGTRAFLVDGGGRHDDPRFGESVLVPLLLDRGVRTLEAVILTHAHPDHCGGLTGAIRHLNVQALWVSPRHFRGECARILLEAARQRATPIRILRGGEIIDLGGARAETVVAETRFRRAPQNNNSVILSVRFGTRSALLTGDIERDAERELGDRISPADVLKIPHHGSRSSSSPALLEASRPRIAVISCGSHNFFGHPHPDVLEALRRRRIRVWRTDVHGSIEMRFGRGRIEVRPQIDTSQ